MKRAVFTLWLLLAAVAATAQSEPTPPEFEYIDMQLPPLHVLMENARHAPQVGYYESNREIEERELKTVRRNWMRNFKLNANYNYGSSDIYNQNYQDSNIPIWTTTTTGREQSWWNVGASFSIPLDEIFNRRNKIKQQKKRIENTQYDLDRWYDELRMKIIDAYTTAVEQLSILRSAAEAKITSEAQYRMTEVDFVKGKLDGGLAFEHGNKHQRRIPVEEKFFKVSPDIIIITHAHADHQQTHINARGVERSARNRIAYELHRLYRAVSLPHQVVADTLSAAGRTARLPEDGYQAAQL